MPISMVLAATSAIYLFFIASVPLTSLIQQLFNGLDNFVLLGVPFLILFFCCLLVITYIPWISLLLPKLLLR